MFLCCYVFGFVLKFCDKFFFLLLVVKWFSLVVLVVLCLLALCWVLVYFFVLWCMNVLCLLCYIVFLRCGLCLFNILWFCKSFCIFVVIALFWVLGSRFWVLGLLQRRKRVQVCSQWL